MSYKTLKHTWKSNLPFPIEVKIHLNLDKKTYWMELNGCQETATETIPNIGEAN